MLLRGILTEALQVFANFFKFFAAFIVFHLGVGLHNFAMQVTYFRCLEGTTELCSVLACALFLYAMSF